MTEKEIAMEGTIEEETMTEKEEATTGTAETEEKGEGTTEEAGGMTEETGEATRETDAMTAEEAMTGAESQAAAVAALTRKGEDQEATVPTVADDLRDLALQMNPII